MSKREKEEARAVADDLKFSLAAHRPVAMTLQSEEAQGEWDARDFSTDYQAALKIRKLPGDLPALMVEPEREHPTTTLFRVGIESILANDPVPEFLELLLRIAKQAERNDVLASMLPEEFPRLDFVQIRKTDEQERQIVESFRSAMAKARASTGRGKLTFREAKQKYYIEAYVDYRIQRSKKTIERAVKKHALDAPAYQIKGEKKGHSD